jgi:hypothetical protein
MSGLGSKSEVSKHLSDSRLEDYVKATRAIVNSYDSVINALVKIQDDTHENGYTKREHVLSMIIIEVSFYKPF